jgi:hypothetical protein
VSSVEIRKIGTRFGLDTNIAPPGMCSATWDLPSAMKGFTDPTADM